MQTLLFPLSQTYSLRKAQRKCEKVWQTSSKFEKDSEPTRKHPIESITNFPNI